MLSFQVVGLTIRGVNTLKANTTILADTSETPIDHHFNFLDPSLLYLDQHYSFVLSK